MKGFDEETALAVLFENTRTTKRNVDLITIAKVCKYLVELYGSQRAVAKKVGLSTEMIREFLTPLKLPEEVQRLIKTRRIDSVDTVCRIAMLNGPRKQIAAANAFLGLLSKDIRDIKRFARSASLSLSDAKETVLSAKLKGMHIFVIDFDDETYQGLIEEAKTVKVKPAELVKDIITNWLQKMKRKRK